MWSEVCEVFNIDVEDKMEEKKEQTNEEWFSELSTETKARIIHLVYITGYRDGFNGAETIPLRDITEWLKQPHKEKHNG